ncbi:hypothetical protein D3C75_1039630 [compost metagenome]
MYCIGICGLQNGIYVLFVCFGDRSLGLYKLAYQGMQLRCASQINHFQIYLILQCRSVCSRILWKVQSKVVINGIQIQLRIIRLHYLHWERRVHRTVFHMCAYHYP